jgi:hypothetical protein
MIVLNTFNKNVKNTYYEIGPNQEILFHVQTFCTLFTLHHKPNLIVYLRRGLADSLLAGLSLTCCVLNDLA